MSWHNKVIWTEGMFLRPSHFQQQERHFQFWLETRCAHLQPYSWGLIEFEIDQQLLNLGKFGLTRCRGVFPDGTPISIADHHPAPTPIDIPETARDLTVYLSLPVRLINTGEVDWNGQDADTSRYRIKDLELKDVHSESTAEPALIQSGELCTKLRLSSQNQDGFVSIPLARISERKADKQVVLDKDYIPACLHSGAASQLKGYLDEVEGLLQQRGDALAKRIGSPGAGGVAEIVDFLLLQIVNRHQPLISHFTQLAQLHPELLFNTLLKLVGELATMTRPERRPTALPVYRHEDLAASFVPLMAALREALSWVSASRAVPIPLEEHPYKIRTAIIHDREMLKSAEFVLAANADLPTETFRTQLPRQTTIATVEKLRELVMSHVPGIRLTALAVAPRQIPFHQGMTYFTLDKHHALWQELEKSGTIAMHFSGDYPGLTLEFWAIRE